MMVGSPLSLGKAILFINNLIFLLDLKAFLVCCYYMETVSNH